MSKPALPLACRMLLFRMAAAAAMILPLQAQTVINRVAYPRAIPPDGPLYAVDARTRAMTGSIPLGAIGGEIPVPLGLRMNGSYRQQIGFTKAYDPDLGKSVIDSFILTEFPMYATFHFGYISAAANYNGVPLGAAYVLEDGSVRTSSDFASSGTPTISTDFGFNAPSATQSFSTSQDVTTYLANAADLVGASYDWTARVQGLAPVGFGAAPTQWTLLFTKDRGRVYAYIADFQAWMPILMMDKFRHTVGLQWTKQTANLPAGVTAIYSVKVLNRFNKGGLVQWASYASTVTGIQDLLRADCIGMDAPSMLVRGYPGVAANPPTWITTDSYDIINIVPPRVAPVFRPTSVQIGSSNQLAAPSWISAGQPIPAMVPRTAGPVLSWTYAYDANQAAVNAMTEPNGTFTSFGYDGSGAIPLGGGSGTGYSATSISACSMNQALTYTAPSGGTLVRAHTWTIDTSVPAESATIVRETRDPGGAFLKETRIVWSTSGQTAANGVSSYAVVRDAAVPSKIYQRTDYAYTIAGTDGSLTPTQIITTSFPDPNTAGAYTAPTQVLTRAFSSNGLQVLTETLAAKPGGGSTSTNLQKTTYTYASLPSKLEPARPLATSVVRYASNGTTVLQPTPPMQKLEYDNGGSGPGLVSKQYSEAFDANNVSQGQQGKTIAYDPAHGWPISIATYNSAYAAGTIQKQDFTIDAATGHLTQVKTTYATALGNAATSFVTKTFGNFDSLDRPLTVTDERGVSATVAYDTLGRLLSRQVSGQRAETYAYPDFFTTQITQGGRITTTVQDRLGRTASVMNPDGTQVLASYAYDTTNRRETLSTRRVSSLGASQTPGTVSYDALGRTVSQINPGGRGALVNTAYAANGLLARATRTLDPAGVNAVSTSDRNILGQVVSATDPAGTVAATAYDGQGHASSIVLTDKNGAAQSARTFAYDPWGRLTSRNEPETGLTAFAAFDALNNPASVTEGGSRTRALAFDGLGRLLSQSNGGDAVAYAYTGADLTSASSASAGQTVNQTFLYNGPGRQLSQESTTVGGFTTAMGYAYDAATGNLNSIVYPSGRMIGYAYDALDRVTGILNNGSTLVGGIAFNEWGQRQRLTFGSAAYSDWSVKDGGTHLDTWTVGYVTGGLVDPGNPRRFNYDSGERLSQAGEWSLVHDKSGRIVTADAGTSLGITSQFAHDGFDNNVTHTSTGSLSSLMNNFSFASPLSGNRIPPLTQSGQATGWLYGGAGGEATQMADKAGSGNLITLGWDGLGRLATVGCNGATRTHAYAPSGMRVQVRDTAGSSANNRRYSYASGGLLMSEFGAVAGTDSVHSGQKALRMHHVGNDGWSGFSRTLAGTFLAGDTLTGTAWFKAPPGVYGEMYLGDAGGPDPHDNANHAYMQGNGGWQQITLSWTMRHDDQMWVYVFGNQWTPTGYGTSTDVSGPAVDWDDVQVSSVQQGVVLSDGIEDGMTFIADWQAVGGWFNPGGVPFEVITLGQEDPNAWRRDVVYLGSEPIAEIDADGVHELHKDHLGSPRIVTRGSDGTIEARQAYAGYGEKVLADGSYVPLTGYTGHIQADPTGLIYMRGRFYSPAWHVFVNSDQGVDPLSLNQRAYVGGSPFMATDPSGRKICTETTRTYIDAHGNTGIEGVLECWDGGVAGGDGSSGNSGGGDPWEWGGGGDGGDPVEPLSPTTPKPQTPKNRDEDACAAYRALVAKYGGVPTGTNEAGAELYKNGNSYGFTDPIFQAGRPGRSPSASNLLNSWIPSGAVRIGYVHTHPGWISTYSDGSAIPENLQLGLQASGGDYQGLNEMNTPLGLSQLAGYITTPGLWANNQMIKFGYVTINGKQYSSSQFVNCR